MKYSVVTLITSLVVIGVATLIDIYRQHKQMAESWLEAGNE